MVEAASDGRPARRRTPLPLFWRVFLPNAILLSAAAVALSVSPASIPGPDSVQNILILVSGLALMLVINVILMRREFLPLERLAGLMRRIEPLAPGKRLPSYTGSAEVAELAEAFNEMLDRLETERRDYARRSLAAEERERRRIARELHDEIGQTITALMLQLGTAARIVPEDSAASIEAAAETGRTVLDDLHRIVRQLRPEALDDLGLARAIDALCDRVAGSSGMHVSRSLDANLPALTPEEELVFYRIAQESLTNAVRHSGGSSVNVALATDDSSNDLILNVKDNGSGITPDPRLGAGIRGMRERALLIGARLTIAAHDHAGTEVSLQLPSKGI